MFRTEFSAVKDSLLKNNHLLLLSVAEDEYMPLRIIRSQISSLYYNFISNISGFLPLGPTGNSSPPSGNQSYFVDNQQLGIQAIQGAQNIFRLSKAGEILQVFYGISPSYLRTMLKQPLQTFVFNLDTETATIIPQPSFIEMGIDGFQSPLRLPQPETEFFVIGGVSVRFTLMNMAPIAISPSLNFIINRLAVEPVTDAGLIRSMIEGRIPAKVADLGAIDADTGTDVRYELYGMKGPVSRQAITAGGR